jgi:hypothetical protein
MQHYLQILCSVLVLLRLVVVSPPVLQVEGPLFLSSSRLLFKDTRSRPLCLEVIYAKCYQRTRCVMLASSSGSILWR